MYSFKELKHFLKSGCVNDGAPHKVALIGDTATQLLGIAIQGSLVSRKIPFDFFEAEFNQVERQILDASSDLHKFDPDFLIVYQSTHKLMLKHAKAAVSERAEIADGRLSFAMSISKSFPNAKIVYFNYPEIDDSIYGSYSNRINSSFLYQTRKLNFELMNLSRNDSNFYICDISSIQNKIGRDNIYEGSIYVNTEILMSTDATAIVADRATSIIASLLGASKKCLILDLDNTLWGGIIGDDGMDRIQIGHGIGIGKAFSEFQLWCKKLKERGIILAVCSKNDENVAKQVFREHPDMILKLDDIAVFVANWETKVDNIRHIQKILNIGFDSMVFLDDNPFERNIVRQNIPEITVPELPEDPADYLEFLYNENLFETTSASQNDDTRTKQYQLEAQRASYQKNFQNEDEFLSSLNMRSDVQPLNKFNTPRVAQLSQRSNQFNLRTVRYDESDLERISSDPSYITLTFTLSDSFGDNGLICVVILKQDPESKAFIESWFMSCRVLKRGMENYVLNCIVDEAKKRGIKRIIGEYIPTKKNSMVASHYTNLGFICLNVGSGKNMFALDVESYKHRKTFIKRK